MHPSGLGGGAQGNTLRGKEEGLSIIRKSTEFQASAQGPVLDLVQTILWVSDHTLVPVLP